MDTRSVTFLNVMKTLSDNYDRAKAALLEVKIDNRSGYNINKINYVNEILSLNDDSIRTHTDHECYFSLGFISMLTNYFKDIRIDNRSGTGQFNTVDFGFYDNTSFRELQGSSFGVFQNSNYGGNNFNPFFNHNTNSNSIF